jgi:hypothetical protein
MSKKYAWTLIAFAALLAVAWFVSSSEPSTTVIETAKRRPAPRPVADHVRHRPAAMDPNRTTWDTRVSDFGITCEACHGPGEAHAAFHTLDPDATKQADDPIVNPMDLPTSERSDLCGQCHGMMMVSIDDAADQEQFFTHGRRFRPGDRLDEAYFLRVVRASEEHRESETFRKFNAHPGATLSHFWPDGQMRVTGRDYTSMIESKCFQQGELSSKPRLSWPRGMDTTSRS